MLPGSAHGIDGNAQHVHGMEVHAAQQEEPEQGRHHPLHVHC